MNTNSESNHLGKIFIHKLLIRTETNLKVIFCTYFTVFQTEIYLQRSAVFIMFRIFHLKNILQTPNTLKGNHLHY
jgi:hypothetical protein